MAILTLIVTVAAWIFLLVKRDDISMYCSEYLERVSSASDIGGVVGSSDACDTSVKSILIGGAIGVVIGNFLSVSERWKHRIGEDQCFVFLFFFCLREFVDLLCLRYQLLLIPLKAKQSTSPASRFGGLSSNILQNLSVLVNSHQTLYPLYLLCIFCFSHTYIFPKIFSFLLFTFDKKTELSNHFP